jgi:UDP-hydrolysing UDP-N-acetyl-D-glucosamine 2-epimerase
MKLLFLTGSRGEWGYIRPILKLCQQQPTLEYSICATNMHLLPAYGMAVDEIRADGFRVDDEIYMSLEGHNHYTMVKSLGIFLCSFADVLRRVQPDWLILAGDRGEQLMGAICAGYTYVPTAHIQAGELSGNIDGIARHALGKFAHLHFASNADAAERLRRLGEEEFRIHLVGAPQLDELVSGFYSTPAELLATHGFDVHRPYIMVVVHPVTEEYADAENQIRVLGEALKAIDLPKIWILSNNDAGSDIIRRGINRYRHGETLVFANLKRQDYLGFLKNARCLVGNSSSGILEAPTFKVAAVNIGRRQHNRIQGKNVINVPHDQAAIRAAIQMACSVEFQAQLADCVNPYGDGRSSERILQILGSMPRTAELLAKQLTY